MAARPAGPVVTLTTDFGAAAPYVAVMKGVILALNPAARPVDLSHAIRPQDVRHADYFLGAAVPFFPPGTVHLAVVDPGVGGARRPLLVEAGGQFLVGPDNGLFTRAVKALGGRPAFRHLTAPRFRRPEVSATFHGRDVFAPAAAHLTLGADPAEFGPAVDDLIGLPCRAAVCWGRRWDAEVQFVDDFGNLITTVPAGRLKGRPARAAVGGGDPRPIRWARTYSDAAAGELIGLASSDGFVELAVVNGSAARELAAGVGAVVALETE